MLEGSVLSAVLGPTNTGKTHRAVERMLSHDSGMIGLPLRLLAREVYDSITSRVGEQRVALVTGEEKRIPRAADYWVCTVEAMPVEREVDFVAIDEIQLAANEQRGHVFTERLLSARGRRETWFLGAETMREAIAELVPAARVISHPRLSKLTFRGMDRMGKIPPRSAVIGFSAAQVFELGERLRASRGGAAVVMGALSPRTRNAQVAMFQAGEVDYLVATDAVGMGLNLHVGHVAFAARRKFDGQRVRELLAAELGQIAGRAGRYLNDGTFGTLDPLILPDDVARAIEQHHFPPVKRLFWRSSELDFRSADALLASLRERPRSRWLKLVEDAEDTISLSLLAGDERVRSLLRSEEDVALLWDVCRIPDFRKQLAEDHARLLGEVFLELRSPSRRISRDFMESRIRAIDDVAGEVETLTDRLAKIRTLTFLAHHPTWTADAVEWQERARDVEDRLSDALHVRLVQRFVERGGAKRRRTALARARTSSTPTTEVETVDASHPFARLSRWRGAVATSPAPPPSPDDDGWIESLVAAPHAAFSVDVTGKISWSGRHVGALSRGARLLLPEVKLTRLEDVGEGARARIHRRLTAFSRDLVHDLLGPLGAPSVRELSAPARGLLYQLEQGLGTALTGAARAQLTSLPVIERAVLETLGVVLGQHVVHVPRLLSRENAVRRLALVTAFEPRAPRPPAPGAVSLAVDTRVPEEAYVAIGYPVVGSRAVRADVLERVAAAVLAGPVDPRAVAHWTGSSPRIAEELVAALSGVAPGEARP